MRTSDFDYELPPELIAQTPVEPRDTSRLLVVDRRTGELAHRHFMDLPEYLRPGDLLVGNDSRVIPARLQGTKLTGGAVEILLLKPVLPDDAGSLKDFAEQPFPPARTPAPAAPSGPGAWPGRAEGPEGLRPEGLRPEGLRPKGPGRQAERKAASNCSRFFIGLMRPM